MQDAVFLERAREAAHADLAHAARQVLAALKPVPTAEQILADLAAASRESDAQLRTWDGTGTPPLPVETMVAGVTERHPFGLAALRELAVVLPHVPSDLLAEALRAAPGWPGALADGLADGSVSSLTPAELANILPRVLVRGDSADPHWPGRNLLAVRRLRRLARAVSLDVSLDIPTAPLLSWLEQSAGKGGFWPVLRAEVVGLLGVVGRDVPRETFETLRQEGSALVEAAAARALLARGEPFTVEYFLAVWRRQSNSLVLVFPFMESVDIYAALASFGRPGVEPLVTWARSGNARERTDAFWGLVALSSHVPGSWIPDDPFLTALTDPSPQQRVVAVRTVAAMGRPSLLGHVARALEDPEMIVRFAALEALIYHPGSAPPHTLAAVLTEMLNDVNDGGRERVLKYTWRLGKDAPAETMVQMLGDTNDNIRAAAAAALNRTHHDALTTVAEAAAAIVDGRPAAAPFDSLVHSRTLLRIAREPQPSMFLLEHAAALLVWPYWEVRMYAAQALRPPPPPNTVPPSWLLQLEALAGDPGFPGVQQAAREALERLSKDR